jgi:hypothetical protein
MPLGKATKPREIQVSLLHTEREESTQRQVALKRELTKYLFNKPRNLTAQFLSVGVAMRVSVLI